MYSFCCKHNVLLRISRKVFTIRASIRSITLFGNFQHCQKSKLVRLFSASTLDDEQSFTVSYLVNSCGFSLEDAKSVSTKVQLRNSIKPDSVLVSLRTYGFTDTFITILVKRLPRVLLANSEKTLNPKLEFLNSIGISSNVLVKLVSQNYPTVFCISEKKTSKILDFLVNKMGYKSGDIARSPSILSYSLERRIIPMCLVLKVLLLKGLLMKKVKVSSLIACSSKQFEKFINRYNEEVPQLLNFYEGNSTLSQFGFSSDDVNGVKHCNCK